MFTLGFTSKILLNHCIKFLPGITVIPREMEDKGYAKFWGVNKVYYGLRKNGEYEKVLHLHHQIKLFKNLTSVNWDLTYPYLPSAGDWKRRFFLQSLRMNVLHGNIDRNIRQVFPWGINSNFSIYI